MRADRPLERLTLAVTPENATDHAALVVDYPERNSAGEVAKRDIRIGRLDTIEGVRKELGRLYTSARRNAGRDVDAGTAAKLGYLLHSIAKTLEIAELEKRIAALETERARW